MWLLDFLCCCSNHHCGYDVLTIVGMMFSTFFPLTCTPHSYCNDTYRNTISNLTSQVCLLQRCHDESWYQLRHDTIRPCHWFSMTTRCYTYLFHLQDMQSKGEAAGFHTEECEYVTVYNTNRKTGVQLRRVFVHALFRKPSWRRKKNLSLIATLESATAKRLFITSGAHCLHKELWLPILPISFPGTCLLTSFEMLIAEWLVSDFAFTPLALKLQLGILPLPLRATYVRLILISMMKSMFSFTARTLGQMVSLRR